MSLREPLVYTREREDRETNIKNTRRVERVLKLIPYLQQWRTNADICRLLGIHNKSVHRYLNLLIRLGFTVEFLHQKRFSYRISNAQEWLTKSGESEVVNKGKKSGSNPVNTK